VTGEANTKSTQTSVRELIMCRSELPIGQEVKDKISYFRHVAPLWSSVSIQWWISIKYFFLFLDSNQRLLQRWVDLARRVETNHKIVTILLVGKYKKLEDSYASIFKSFNTQPLRLA
jgi:CTP synthase